MNEEFHWNVIASDYSDEPYHRDWLIEVKTIQTNFVSWWHDVLATKARRQKLKFYLKS